MREGNNGLIKLPIFALVLGSLFMPSPVDDDDETTSLGARLRVTRVERGLTLTETSRQLDVARSAYRMWEIEVASPQPDRWPAIAEWLGVPMPTFLRHQGLLTPEEERAALAASPPGGTDPTEPSARPD